MNICGDNRFEIIEKAKEAILEGTNIDTSPDEMKVLDNFLFRCWQMGWLDKYESKKNVSWIPCSERLPDNTEHDWVLAQVQEDNGFMWLPKVMEYRQSKDDWYCDSEFGGWLKERHGDAFKVIAWMPLPEPYKESDDGQAD